MINSESLEEKVRIKDQVFLSTLTWIVISLGITLCYVSLIYFCSIIMGFSALSSFMVELESSVEFNKTGDEIRFLRNIIILLNVFLILISVFIIATGFGMKKRKKWARISYILLSIITSLILIIVAFYLINQHFNEINTEAQSLAETFIPSAPEELKEVLSQPEVINAWANAKKIRSLGIGVFLLFGAWLIIKSISKINQEQIKKLFE